MRNHRSIVINNKGVALVEFAIVLPVMLLLFVGGIELARYILFKEKLNSAATQMLNIINQSKNPDAASLNNVYAAFPEMMKPFVVVQGGLQIAATQIVNPANGASQCKPVVLWKFPEISTKISADFSLGSVADTKNIALMGGDSLMAIEIYAPYEPMLGAEFVKNLLSLNKIIYAYNYSHTRYGQFDIHPVTKNLVEIKGNVNGAPCAQLARSGTKI